MSTKVPQPLGQRDTFLGTCTELITEAVVLVVGLAFWRWTFTTSKGVTANAVMRDPTDPEMIRALALLLVLEEDEVVLDGLRRLVPATWARPSSEESGLAMLLALIETNESEESYTSFFVF